MKPLISIITPVYKAEKYLDRCVESIVGQTYENLEIILIDDGSPDNCPAMCDEWAKRDGRIKVIHRQNGGAAMARNAGLDIAGGDYIGFVDSDDYIEKSMFEELMSSAEQYNSDIVLCGWNEVKQNGEKIKSLSTGFDDGLVSQKVCLKRIYRYGYAHNIVCNKLYKRFLWEDIRFPDFRKFEDEAVLTYVYEKADTISSVGLAAYNYVQEENSVMHEEFNDKDLLYIDILEKALKHYVDIGMDEEILFEAVSTYIATLRGRYVLIKINGADFDQSFMKNLLKKYRKSFKYALKNNIFAQDKQELYYGLIFYLFPNLYSILFRRVKR